VSPDQGKPPPLARILGAGARGAERVADATGVSTALDEAVEEAIVRAFRSPALRRALERGLEEAGSEAELDAKELAATVRKVLQSEAATEIWAEILASQQAQMLVQRIADAPEVRAALTAQTAGLVRDIGVRLTRLTEALDDAIEKAIRPNSHEEETDQAGLATRSLAGAIDIGLLFLLYTLASAFLGAVFPATIGGKLPLLAIGILTALAVIVGAGIIVAFWALVGQTPGMRFLSIRIVHGQSHELGLGLANRRMALFLLGLLPAGLVFLSIAADPQRRAWHDRVCGTEVIYDRSGSVAPYARRDSDADEVRRRRAPAR
jgi:uncharacterized RDD family membrane protein YckC